MIASPRVGVLFALLWGAIAILAAGLTVYVLVFLRGPLLPFMGTTGFGALNLMLGVPLAVMAVSAAGIARGLGRRSRHAPTAAAAGSIILALVFFSLSIVGWPIMVALAALHLILFGRLRQI
jgi:hypothetical protein